MLFLARRLGGGVWPIGGEWCFGVGFADPRHNFRKAHDSDAPDIEKRAARQWLHTALDRRLQIARHVSPNRQPAPFLALGPAFLGRAHGFPGDAIWPRLVLYTALQALLWSNSGRMADNG